VLNSIKNSHELITERILIQIVNVLIVYTPELIRRQLELVPGMLLLFDPINTMLSFDFIGNPF